MGKLLNGLILIFIIDLSLVLFLGSHTPTNTLFLLITGGASWNSLSFIVILTTALALASTVGIIAGTIWHAPDSFYVLAPLTTLLLSYGIVFYELYNRLNSYGYFGGNEYIILMFIGPLVLFYVYVIIKFWRGND